MSLGDNSVTALAVLSRLERAHQLPLASTHAATVDHLRMYQFLQGYERERCY